MVVVLSCSVALAAVPLNDVWEFTEPSIHSFKVLDAVASLASIWSSRM